MGDPDLHVLGLEEEEAQRKKAITALILDDFGHLTDYDCEKCSGAVKQERGCGVNPVVETEERDPKSGQVIWREWNLLDYLDACDAKGTDPLTGSIECEYGIADWAYVTDYGGPAEMWPCCPKYFCTFVDFATLQEAARILEIRWAKEDGCLEHVHPGEWTTREFNLIRFTSLYVGKMRDDKAEHEREKRERAADAKRPR